MKKILRILGIFLSIIILIVFVGTILWSIVDRTNGIIVSSGERRDYLLYVPDSYDPSHPTPLVFNIHGFAQWPANQMRVSGWNELADQYGFIVVYPSGTGFPLRWRVSADPENPEGPEKEVAYFSDLIVKLTDEYNIDRSRIYANGLSNGGGMTLLLACRLSDQIAAIGSVAGAYLFDFEDCQPQRPVPAIFFHGKEDQIVPFTGGPSERYALPFPNIPDFVHSYAQKNGCDSTSTTVMNTTSITGIRYSGCSADAAVVFYTIADGGHTWPGGSPLPEWITGKTTQEIDATGLMWKFFQQYSLGK